MPDAERFVSWSSRPVSAAEAAAERRHERRRRWIRPASGLVVVGVAPADGVRVALAAAVLFPSIVSARSEFTAVAEGRLSPVDVDTGDVVGNP